MQCDNVQVIAEKLRRDVALDNYEIVRWNLFSAEQVRSFLRISEELATAIGNGFQGSHCQGGVYTITAAFISRMRTSGYKNDPMRFLYFPMPEDRIIGAYCAAVKLKVRDFSMPGEVFGVQSNRLPYSPKELISRGYALIHSVRNNETLPEENIRRLFAEMRR
jgi:hypothetical protein